MNNFSMNKENYLINSNQTRKILRLIQFLLGCFTVSLAYNIFIASNELVPGGVGGVAVILNNLFGIKYSNVILAMNLLLLPISYLLLGKDKTRASILGSIMFPIFVKLTENINVWLQFDTSQQLLSTVFGGIIYGVGAGMVFKVGFTNGGTDIINQIISKYFKVSLGKSMLMSDGLIVLASGFFLGIKTMMYSIVILYIISIISDRVVLGISNNKTFLIVTSEQEKVKQYIINDLKHGATIFQAKGGYKRNNENVIMTVLPTREYYRLKEGINQIDKDAFYIIMDTYELFGGE